MLKTKTGSSPRRKGIKNELRAVKELNKWLVTLYAVRVPGSGAFAYQGGGPGDPHFQGDIQIRRKCDHRIVEKIESKLRDPMGKKGPITISKMNGWRSGRRILMARHDRGEFLCSVWFDVWEELVAKGDGQPELISVRPGTPTRGVGLSDVQTLLAEWCDFDPGGYAAHWADTAYMNTKSLCALLEEAHGDGEPP